MPSPTSLYIDAALSNLLAKRAMEGFVANAVLPTLASPKLTGSIWKSDPKLGWLRAQDTARAPGVVPNAVDNDAPTTLAYSIVDHALKGVITDEEMAQVDPALVSEIASAGGLQDRLALDREIDLVAAIVAAVTATTSPGTKWNDAGGDIFADIKAQMPTVVSSIGAAPNALVIPYEVILKASESPAWRDRVKQTIGPAEERRLGMASVLGDSIGIDPANIIIASSYKNTANRGATASVSSIWGENVLLFRREPASLRYAGLGLSLGWSGSAGGGGYEVARVRNEMAKCDDIAVHHYYDDIIVNAGAGYLFTNTIT